MIRPVSVDDATAIADIYNYYVAETTITFEESLVDRPEIAARIESHAEGHPWLVAEEDGFVVGYAYSAPWHERSAYRKSIETAIYLSHERLSQGIGSKLYAALLNEIKHGSFHCAFALIGLPNPESVGLVEKFGFTRVGDLREVGRKFNRWVDVGIWQLFL